MEQQTNEKFFKTGLKFFSKNYSHPLADQFGIYADLIELDDRRCKDEGRSPDQIAFLKAHRQQHVELAVETYFEALTTVSNN